MKNRGLPNCIRYIGYGIFNDVRSRIPHYKSDIQDAWNYRIIPSTLFIFFANLLPAISFAQDMYDKTDQLYGVNETLMSSAIAGVVVLECFLVNPFVWLVLRVQSPFLIIPFMN